MVVHSKMRPHLRGAERWWLSLQVALMLECHSAWRFRALSETYEQAIGFR